MKSIRYRLIDRRMILLLILAFALISGCATPCAMSPNKSQAYSAAMAGKIEEARNLLREDPDNSLRSFMLACLELSDGNLSQARRYADEFVSREPYLADGKVLQELIEQRQAYPAEPWTISFASAWKASGSPHMSASDCLFEEQTNEQVEKCEPREIPEAIKGTPEEMLVAVENGLFCDDQKFVELCLSHSTPETPVPIQLLALEWMDIKLSVDGDKLPEELRKRALARKDTLIEELSVKLPLDMRFPLIAAVNRTRDKEEFSSLDIVHIEEAASRPRLSPAPIELYDDYLRRFINIGSETPYLSAFSFAMSGSSDVSYLNLRRKILKTAEKASPELKERLANILEKLGKAQVKQGTLIELMLSSSVLFTAAEIRGDLIAQERMRAVHAFTSRLVETETSVIPVFVWPIHPLVIDSSHLAAKNEVAFYQLFADVDTPAELLQLLK